MKRTLTVAVAVVALAMSTMAVALAGGPADKATGDVDWKASSGLEYRSVFNAHEGRDGRDPKGEVTIYASDGSMRIVDIECVNIDGNEAWFSGPITYADGVFDKEDQPLGTHILHWVQDNATPGADGDLLGSKPGTCSETWTGGGTAIGGNLTVHTDGSEA